MYIEGKLKVGRETEFFSGVSLATLGGIGQSPEDLYPLIVDQSLR